MQKNYIYRGGFYLVGLLVLALGISLNTKTGLGVSPIISVSYSISTIWNLNFGNMTMVLYCIFVLVEMLLHPILYRTELKREDIALEHANEMNLKLSLIHLSMSIRARNTWPAYNKKAELTGSVLCPSDKVLHLKCIQKPARLRQWQ